MGDMVKLDVYKTDGTSTGEQAELIPAIFGIQPNDHAIWMAITVEMDHRRHGTVSTKNRAAVRGGGKKPWKQKGTGRARAGSTRSPLWVGGGRVFGPQPHRYRSGIPRKVKTLARKSILSYKAKEDKIRLVEDFSFETPKTKGLDGILKRLKLADTKTLLLVPKNDKTVYLSGRNLPLLMVKEAAHFSATDALHADMLLIQKSALIKLNEVLGT